MAKRSLGIQGITLRTLWASWRSIRTELKKATVRDVVDYLEYDLNPNKWMLQVLRQLAAGTYEPKPPQLFYLAKSRGFRRLMTMPQIPDLVVYRTCADYLYKRTKRLEHKHVYFERSKLRRMQERVAEEARQFDQSSPASLKALLESWGDYESGSDRRFRTWRQYDQYRKYFVFRRIYPFIVITDITSFFDSILFTHVTDALFAARAPSRMVGLVFVLLERLNHRGGIRENPRIGLAVDEFDCSRKLAHMLLYTHDDRMVDHLGESAYVRWMDDQNLGVESKHAALVALRMLDDSLRKLHLVPNGGKTRILSISEARRYFHLATNGSLDEADQMPVDSDGKKRRLGKKIREAWTVALADEGIGQWDKVLKRFYRLAALARMRYWRRRARRDLMKYPGSVKNIADYMHCTGSVPEFLAFFESVHTDPEQVYEDINLRLVEALLRLEPDAKQTSSIRAIGSSLLAGETMIVGRELCAHVAPLLILRYGDRRSLPLLRRIFTDDVDKHLPQVVRASALVYASYGLDEYRAVRTAAAQLRDNHLAFIVATIEAIRGMRAVPKRLMARLNLRIDSAAPTKYLDMRSLLTARLLMLNRRADVRRWLDDRKAAWTSDQISDYDRALIARLLK